MIESNQDFYTTMARIAAISLPEPGSFSSQYRWENHRAWMEESNRCYQRNLHLAMGYRADQREF